MEEHISSSTPQESAAALSASALRELQQRGQSTLASSREQAARLEAQINEQLDALTSTLSEQIALDSQSSVEVEAFQTEVARLTEELECSRAAWLAERSDLEARLDAVSQKLESADAEREKLTEDLSSAEAARDDLARKSTDLEVEREILAQKVTKLAAQTDDIGPKVSGLETEREDLSLQITRLEAEKNALSEKIAGLEAQRDDLSQKLSSSEATQDGLLEKLAELELQREDLSQKLLKLESYSEDISPQVANLQAQRDDLTQNVSTLESEKTDLSEQLTKLKAKHDELSQKADGLESLRDDLAKKVARLETERDDLTQIASNYETQRNELTQTVATLEAQIQSSQAEWRNQLLDFEGRLREQQNSWVEQRSEWAEARAGLERERDELQQKFDLALEDLQRLRARGAELEQDLARRPESNQADSAELVALRAERDDLAARIEQLEQRPAASIDPDVEQQLADLQRRFELAVEDVREYKTKNAKLESQLAAASSQSRAAAPDTGGNDWESQKRRLLASLEEGANAPETPVQKQQRITIEGTIEMTDAVVAEKDREIAQLQAQLAASGNGMIGNAEHARQINELVEGDEVIVAHRQRIRELEREMQEKLRTAELELSVERAKMARQKAELDDLKSELESKRQEFESSGGGTTSTPGQPKRRWRDKLGLSGDE